MAPPAETHYPYVSASRRQEAKTILVVDDEKEVRDLLCDGLSEFGYLCTPVGGGPEALRHMEGGRFSVVLTDINMPGMDGIQLLENIRHLHTDVDVILITGSRNAEMAIRALRRGASDYLTKPFHLDEVRLTVQRTLEKRRLIRENRDYQQGLEKRVRERTQELLKKNGEIRRLYRKLSKSYQATLEALAGALETRDRETRGHCMRVAAYTAFVAGKMGITGQALADIRIGALLHDIGKIGIPDAILLKPGRLTSREREIMKEHPTIGARLLAGIQFLEGAVPVVLSHQECFDGSGYPDGLRGDRIPLGARIFSVVDTYDAMTSDRPYRRAVSYAEALREIRQHAGTQFDPRVVKEFESIAREDWERIRKRIDQGAPLMDEDDPMLPPP